MPERPERICVPIEVEMVPLYREPAWSARLRRAERREQRHRRRAQRRRILARVFTGAAAVARRGRSA